MDAVVLFVVEQPVTRAELRQSVLTDLPGNGGRILAQISGDVLEGNMVVQ